MKVLSYQSSFFVPIALPLTGAIKWFETGGKVEVPGKNAEAHGAAIDSESQFASFVLQPVGWEVQPVQPNHPRTEKAGSIAKGDDGNQLSIPFTIWQEIWSTFPSHRKWEKAGAIALGDDGTQAKFIFPYVNWGGFEPTHVLSRVVPRAALIGDDGIQLPIPPPVSTSVNWGFEQTFFKTKQQLRGSALDSESQFASFVLQPVGWEVQSVQPNHPRWERAGSIQIGDDGAEAPYVFVPPTPVNFGYDFQPSVLRLYQPNRVSATKGKSDFAFVAVQNIVGWDVQPQDIKRQTAYRAGAILIAGDATQVVFAPAPQGWSIQEFQPPHPRWEKAGAVQVGDSGTEAVYVFVPIVPLIPQGWEIQSFQPPHWLRDSQRGSGLDGESQFASFVLQPVGWEIQAFQPNHPCPEKSSAWMIGEDGIEFPFIPPTPPPPTSEHHDMPFFASMGQLKSW